MRWVVPALTVVLLLALVASVPEGPLARSLGWLPHQVRLTRRWLSLATIAIVSAANSASIILLVHLLLNATSSSRSRPSRS